jgi:excisionase family DNA binding protein
VSVVAGSGARPGADGRAKLTILEVCAELNISRSTFYDWRAKGKAARCIKLPNGEMRIRRTELDRWLASREEGK